MRGRSEKKKPGTEKVLVGTRLLRLFIYLLHLITSPHFSYNWIENLPLKKSHYGSEISNFKRPYLREIAQAPERKSPLIKNNANKMCVLSTEINNVQRYQRSKHVFFLFE